MVKIFQLEHNREPAVKKPDASKNGLFGAIEAFCTPIFTLFFEVRRSGFVHMLGHESDYFLGEVFNDSL